MSSTLLRYHCERGQSYVFEQQVHFLMEQPGAEPIADQGAITYTVSVAETHPDGSVSLDIHVAVSQQFTLYPGLQNENLTCRLNARGEVLSADPRPPLIPFIVFPEGSVALKEAWKTVESSGQKRLSMEHTLTALETVADDTFAHVVSEGSAAGEPAVDLYSVRVFSVDKGHLVLGRSVLKHCAADGRESTLVVEETLRGL